MNIIHIRSQKRRKEDKANSRVTLVSKDIKMALDQKDKYYSEKVWTRDDGQIDGYVFKGNLH